MNTPESLNTESKNLFNLILKNWEELDDSLKTKLIKIWNVLTYNCLLYTSPSPRDKRQSRMPSSA